MDIYTFLVLLHVVGTILGTGGATVAELQIARALRDKRVSLDERALMHANYGMIRVGMAIIFVSVLGMFWYYLAQGNLQPLLADTLLAKGVMFGLIVLNAILLQKRWVPLWLGASISFTSWWGATLLGLAGDLSYSLLTYLTGYVIAIFAVAGLFHMLRFWRAVGILNRRTTILSIALILAAVAFTVFYLIEQEAARDAAADEAGKEVAAAHRTLTERVGFEYPGGSHTYDFTVALDDAGIIQDITAADIDPDNQGRIADFVDAVNEQLVGQPLRDIDTIGKVGGASLTTAAFNEAIDRMQAR